MMDTVRRSKSAYLVRLPRNNGIIVQSLEMIVDQIYSFRQKLPSSLKDFIELVDLTEISEKIRNSSSVQGCSVESTEQFEQRVVLVT